MTFAIMTTFGTMVEVSAVSALVGAVVAVPLYIFVQRKLKGPP